MIDWIAYVKRSLLYLFTALLLASGKVYSSQNLSLVVSGGISFGSYQAGSTWAILAAARNDGKSDLVNFTGASAGNVNAILGAIDWCKKEFPSRPEESLLWELWTTTGIEQLMTRVGSVDAAYQMMWHAESKIRSELKEDAEREQQDKSRLVRENTAISDFPSLFQRYYFEAPETVPKEDGKELVQLNPTNPEYDPTHRQRVEMALNQPELFRSNCAVDLGVTVTSMSPVEYTLPRSAISTEVQRQAIVFRFTTNRSGNGSFTLLDVDQGKAEEAFQRLGVFAEPLPAANTNIVPVATVMKIASASSAFPFAFSPVRMELKIHNAPRNSEQAKASKVEDDSGTRWQWLLDGGVFDNKPLSLSLDLAKLASKPLDHTIYIDQDRRRLSVQEEKSGTSGIEHFGIKGLIGMLSNTASSARKYELFTTGRYLVDIPDDGSVDAPLQATDRYPRVAADHLQAFGAFMGRPLREHDFYAGVYDGLVFYASNYVCKGYLDDALDRCVTDWIGSSELLEQSEAGRLLVMNLCNSEFDNQCGQQKEPENSAVSQVFRLALLKAIQNSLQEIQVTANEENDAPPFETETIKKACDVAVKSPSLLQAHSLLPDVASKDGFVCLLSKIKRKFEADPQIRELVAPSLGLKTVDWNSVSSCLVDWDLSEWQALSDSGTTVCRGGKAGRGEERLYLNSYFIDETFQNLMEHPRRGLRDLQTHLTWWAWAIEDSLNEFQKDGKGEMAVDIFSMATVPTSNLGPNVLGFGLHTKVPNTPPPGNFWPKFGYRLAQFAPSHMSIDSRNGGYDLVWQPGVVFKSSKKVFVNLPWVDQRGRDPAWGAGLGFRLFKEEFVWSGFDVSFSRYNQYTNGSEYAHGVDVGFYFLGNRLRIGIGATIDRSDRFDSMASRRFMFGLSDPGGTAYWLARIFD